MVSIITAVYERNKFLYRVFDSLMSQTVKAFEWIVIDDGSTEPIGNTIRTFKNNAPFEITYKRVKHGGKHRAINEGIKLAKNNAFIIVDSDDALLPNTIEVMCQWWEGIESNSEFVAAAGQMISFDGVISGGEVPFEDYIDILWTDRKKRGIVGESVYIFRRAYWLEYPLPEYENELFCSESITMYKFSKRGWKIRWYKGVVYKYEYLTGGLTQNIDRLNSENPKGYAEVISCAREFDYPTVSKYLCKCRSFYETCYKCVDDMEVREILGISKHEHEDIHQLIKMTIERTKEVLGDQKEWSIYGWGNWGHIMSRYLKLCDYQIKHIYDKNAGQMRDTCVYGLNNDELIANSVIVCVKNIDEEIKRTIDLRFSDATVVFMNGIYIE